MGKRAWFPWFPEAWLSDPEVRRMRRVARSVYFDMLCLQMQLGYCPDDYREVARLLGDDARTICAVWSEVKPRFEVRPASTIAADSASIRRRFARDSASILVQIRLETEANRARFVADLQRKRAESRWTRDAGAYAAGTNPASPRHMPLQLQLQNTTYKNPAERAAGAAGQGRTRKAAKSKNPAAPVEVGPFLAHVMEAWKGKYRPADGKPPTLTQADRGQAIALVKRHGLDEAKRLYDCYLADGDRWISERCHPLALLSKRVDQYRATRPDPSERGWACNNPNWHEPGPALAVGGEVKL